MESLWLIPVLPLLGAMLMFTWGRIWEQESLRLLHWTSCGVVLGSFLLACGATLQLDGSFHYEYAKWMPRFGANFGLLLDSVNQTLLLVVTGIGFLIHLFSIGYMRGEAGQARYFGAMNLFVFFMLLLILADNYLLAFVGWEGVGLCSYLLIGFYTERPAAGAAAMKAFLMNRIGDTGFFLAILAIFSCFGTLTYTQIAVVPHAWIPFIALGLFLAATGKSAQLPLFTWLPDAMEGPTPVSALIHAATMVTAGIYLLARSSALLALAPDVGLVIAVTGTLTAFLAATIAFAQNDIKKVLAYSTISQLGFMVAACGAGAYQAAMFHVLTHAFFKALLFLGAGVVIHSLHGEQDMRRMGGLNQTLPGLFILMVIGALALSGLPPFAGFFSKDMVLHAVHDYAPMLYYILLLTALLTALYMGRFLRMIFLGLPRTAQHVHQPEKLLMATLLPLAAGSIFAGLYSIWLPDHFDTILAVESSVIAAFGFFLAFRFTLPEPKFLLQGWHLDELYNIVFVKGLAENGSRLLAAIDRTVVDGGVNGTAWGTRGLSKISGIGDRYIVDGLVRATSFVIEFSSFPVRFLQSGFLHGYALWLVVSILGLVVFLTWGQSS